MRSNRATRASLKPDWVTDRKIQKIQIDVSAFDFFGKLENGELRIVLQRQAGRDISQIMQDMAERRPPRTKAVSFSLAPDSRIFWFDRREEKFFFNDTYYKKGLNEYMRAEAGTVPIPNPTLVELRGDLKGLLQRDAEEAKITIDSISQPLKAEAENASEASRKKWQEADEEKRQQELMELQQELKDKISILNLHADQLTEEPTEDQQRRMQNSTIWGERYVNSGTFVEALKIVREIDAILRAQNPSLENDDQIWEAEWQRLWNSPLTHKLSITEKIDNKPRYVRDKDGNPKVLTAGHKAVLAAVCLKEERIKEIGRKYGGDRNIAALEPEDIRNIITLAKSAIAQISEEDKKEFFKNSKKPISYSPVPGTSPSGTRAFQTFPLILTKLQG